MKSNKAGRNTVQKMHSCIISFLFPSLWPCSIATDKKDGMVHVVMLCDEMEDMWIKER